MTVRIQLPKGGDVLNGTQESHFHIMIALMLVFFGVAQAIDVLNHVQGWEIDNAAAWEMTKALMYIALGMFRGMLPSNGATTPTRKPTAPPDPTNEA